MAEFYLPDYLRLEDDWVSHSQALPPLALGFLGEITSSFWTACPFKVLTLCCCRSTHIFWPKWWNLQPNAKEYVQLMKRQQWTIIYRWFGRSRPSETRRILFPVLVPVKSSFMQIKHQRKENEWLEVWENFAVPFYSWGQIFNGHSEILLSVCVTLNDWELDRLTPW